MGKLQQETAVCQICKKQKKMSELLSAEVVLEIMEELALKKRG